MKMRTKEVSESQYLLGHPVVERFVCKNNEKTQRVGTWWIFWDWKYGVITLLNMLARNVSILLIINL